RKARHPRRERTAPHGGRPTLAVCASPGGEHQKPMPPMPPIPPPAPAGAGGSGLSATTASVGSSIEAIDAAFCSAARVTLAGSITPALTRSSYSPVAAL